MKNLLYAVSTVVILTIFSRILGFLREIVLANYLGANSFADQVIFLYTIPLYLQLIIGGAFTTAFISIGIKEENNEVQIYFTTKRILNIFTVFTVILLFIINLDDITSFEAMMSYFLSFITMFFYNQYSLLSGKYNIEKAYAPPLIAIGLNNIVGIMIIVAFNSLSNNQSLLFYSISFLFSGIIAWTYLRLSLQWDEYKFKSIKYSKKYAKRILGFSIPIVLGGAIPQLLNLIQRLQISFLQEDSSIGMLAMFNYASKIIGLPQSIIVSIIATILFPKIVRNIKKSETNILNQYKKVEKIILFSMTTFSVLLILSSKLITQLLFYFGNLTLENKDMIADIISDLAFLSLFLVLIVFVTRYFYALELNKISVLVSFLCTIVFNNFLFMSLANLSFDPLYAVMISSYASAILNYSLLRMILIIKIKGRYVG